MSERTRKKERREARAAKPPVPVEKIAPPAPLNSQRNSFRVKQAKRAVADAFPDLVKVGRRPEGARAKWMNLGPSETHAIVERQVEAKRRPSAGHMLDVPRQVDLSGAKLPQGGKCRPKDNTPKGAAGSGRDFIPWRKDCS